MGVQMQTNYVLARTWEIELLGHYSQQVQMSLHTAMMSLSHPSNTKFALCHSIDRHWIEKCHVLAVLKSAESQACAMITGMLPYLQWKFGLMTSRKEKS